MRNNWDFDDFGENIRRTVQDAVDSRNFASLNRTISNTINSAFGLFSDEEEQQRPDIHLGPKPETRFYEASSDIPPKQPQRYARTGGKKILAMSLAAAGYGIGGILLLGCIVVALSLPLIGGRVTAVAAGTLGVLALPCIAAGIAGTRLLGRVKRFNAYLSVLGHQDYCNVRDLAERLRKTDSYVVKDLEYMLSKRWFLQGHLDRQNTCLMTTDAAYREYLRLMRQREEQKQSEAAKSEAERSRYADMDPRVREVVAKGNEFIEKMRACNDAIPGEEISAKIFRMETLTRRIFARVEDEPDTVADIRRLMEYYLPTAVKLLEAYEDLDAQPVQGENILSSKKEIEETLDTLNTAFEKLLDDMFQDTAWDVSSDISVLKTMLAQEGLTEKDFKTGGKA